MKCACDLLYCYLWPATLYNILLSVACHALQYIVICGLPRCTIYCYLWPATLYNILLSVACHALQYIVICGLPRSTIYCCLWPATLYNILLSVACHALQYTFHIISQKASFSEQKKIGEHKECVVIFCTSFL